MTDNPWVEHPDYPGLLRCWDATAARLAQTCWRRFFYKQIEGWRYKPRLDQPASVASVHTDFGSMWHACVELYDRERLAGKSPDEATDAAIAHALTLSWDDERGAPWGGEVMSMWTCTGVKNPTGKRRKFFCEAAKGEWVEKGPQPVEKCPKCGRPVERRSIYVPYHASKNRTNLLRAVLLYCDDQATSGLRPTALEDGTPALEIRFELDLPYQSPDGRPYVLCGHLDRITQFGGGGGSGVFPHERKTTTSALGRGYFGGFAPNPQIDTYDWAAHRLYMRHEGVIVEAVQVLSGGVRMLRSIITRGPENREEWERELGLLIAEAQANAGRALMLGDRAIEAWPRRTASCASARGGMPCEFRDVCASAPSMRQHMMETMFEQGEPWNPMHED